METLDQVLDFQDEINNQKLYVTEEICEQWEASAKWTRYLGITLIATSCLFICAVMYLVLATSFQMPGFFWLGLMVILSPMLAIGYYLIQYAKNIQYAASDSDWTSMETGFSSLSYSFSIYGILMFLFLAGLAMLLILFGGKIIAILT